MTEGPAHILSPVYGIAASGPMAIPSLTDTQWRPLEVGVIWGLKHGTSWLMASLQAPESMQKLPLVLQLQWDTPENDPLLLRIAAPLFLHGPPIAPFYCLPPVPFLLI